MSKEKILAAIDDLPPEPLDAFVKLCVLLQDIDYSKTTGEFDLFAMDLLVSFSARFQIEIPNRFDGETTLDYIRSIIDHGVRIGSQKEVSDILEKYDRSIETRNFGFAQLDNVEKDTIRSRLNEIRNIVVSSRIKDSKKKSLLRKIQSLEKEIELLKTGTDMFFGFLADLALVSGEMAQNAKPAIDEFKDILRIVMRSRAKVEDAKLPGSDNWPQLPSPEDIGDL